MILVTGGTGLIGSHLLLKLAQKNSKIRAIYRDISKLEQVKTVFSYYSKSAETLFNTIDWVEADITDIPALESAFKNITHVYHCAGLISFALNDFKKLKKVNIEGTANVVNLCISNSIKKLCHISSIAALGTATNKHITEETHWNPETDNSVYAISKYGGEIEVWRGSREGLDVIIINPGVVLGPGFWKSGSGKLFSKIRNGFNYFVTGSTGYVAVNDTVDAMALLMEKPIKNERYILVGENLSFKNIAKKIAYKLNVTPPRIEVKSYMLQIAWRLDWLKHLLFRTPRVLSKTTANTALNKEHYSSDKIKRDLGFKFTPIDNAINTTCAIYLKE